MEDILESFENALQQVENFHFSLCILREQLWLYQMLKDGKIASLRD